jgi:hypothetical protein
VSLKEIKDKVERDHPDWDAGRKLDEIRRLRHEEKAAKRSTATPAPASPKVADGNGDGPTPATVGEAWAFLALVAIGMRLIGWAVWRDVFNEPHWYDALHAGLTIVGICAVVGAYRRRPNGQ